MSPLYIRTILKDTSAFLCIKRILAFASSGRDKKRDPTAKPQNLAAAKRREKEFPWGGEYSPIKVTGVLVGKF